MVHNPCLTLKISFSLSSGLLDAGAEIRTRFMNTVSLLMLTKLIVRVTASVYHTAGHFRNFKYMTSSALSIQLCQNKRD